MDLDDSALLEMIEMLRTADGVGQRTGYGSFPARLPEHPLLPRSGRTERP